MKIKCSHCSETTDVTIDRLIFENEDEELFVTFLALKCLERRGKSNEYQMSLL
ncbi:MAG: hypothetical protein ACR2LL_09305 [Nitrosopumilus sp.]